MIWENNSKGIIMLNKIVEKNVVGVKWDIPGMVICSIIVPTSQNAICSLSVLSLGTFLVWLFVQLLYLHHKMPYVVFWF